MRIEDGFFQKESVRSIYRQSVRLVLTLVGAMGLTLVGAMTRRDRPDTRRGYAGQSADLRRPPTEFA